MLLNRRSVARLAWLSRGLECGNSCRFGVVIVMGVLGQAGGREGEVLDAGSRLKFGRCGYYGRVESSKVWRGASASASSITVRGSSRVQQKWRVGGNSARIALGL